MKYVLSVAFSLVTLLILPNKQNYVPKVKVGHVVPGIGLDRVKLKLEEVRGSLVECPMVCIIFFPVELGLTFWMLL